MLVISPGLGAFQSFPQEIRDKIYDSLFLALPEDTTTPQHDGLCWVHSLLLVSKDLAKELKQAFKTQQKSKPSTAQQKEKKKSESEYHTQKRSEEVGGLQCCHFRSYSFLYETTASPCQYARCIGNDRLVDIRFSTAGRGKDSPTAVVLTFTQRPTDFEQVALALVQPNVAAEVFGASKQRDENATSQLYNAMLGWQNYGISSRDNWNTVANRMRSSVEVAAFGKGGKETKGTPLK